MQNETKNSNLTRIPPGQQLVAPGKWPIIGQRAPSESDRPWRVTIKGQVEHPITLSLEQLAAEPQQSMTIDIHCVTRWSKLDANFSGVSLEHLLARVKPKPTAKYVSFTSRTDNHHSSSLEIDTAINLKALLATHYSDQPLPTNHGGPIRCIVPGRYFYKSVKWVESIELLDEDQLGNWEAESGYHNLADPWQEQRYMAPEIDKRRAEKLIASRDFSEQSVRSIDCSKRDLSGLNARLATLRDAKFIETNLADADFQEANLANSHFRLAKLSNANFKGADVEGADFSGADLRGADFTAAATIGASFFNPLDKELAAILDGTTVIPTEQRSKLSPDQLAYVEKSIDQKH